MMGYIRCIPVVSSNIEAIGYDRQTRTLRVTFKTGAYDYADVPPEVALDLLFAESHGKFLAEAVKNVYEYRKIEVAEMVNDLRSPRHRTPGVDQ